MKFLINKSMNDIDIRVSSDDNRASFIEDVGCGRKSHAHPETASFKDIYCKTDTVNEFEIALIELLLTRSRKDMLFRLADMVAKNENEEEKAVFDEFLHERRMYHEQ